MNLERIEFPDLAHADETEVGQHLIESGITGPTRTFTEDGALVIMCVAADRPAVESAMADYQPTAPKGTYRTPLPPAVRNAIGRMRQRADAGDAMAQDVLILMRYMNRRFDQ